MWSSRLARRCQFVSIPLVHDGTGNRTLQTVEIWNKARLLALIADKIEESSTLDYKAADALDGSDKKKGEITKDVAAFANSGGGTIIYGIREHAEADLAHLPKELNPVKVVDFSKERLDQIIQTIRPKVEGVRISSVPVNDAGTDVCYVVEIPQSTTAHQARDFRYYRRRNFVSEPMEDYEIRDVMMRQKHPAIAIDFFLATSGNLCGLRIVLSNKSTVVAHHVCAYVRLPGYLKIDTKIKDYFQFKMEGGQIYYEAILRNVHKDLIRTEPDPHAPFPGPRSDAGVPEKRYYISRSDPILPRMTVTFAYGLDVTAQLARKDDEVITWEVYADNAPVVSGTTPLASLAVR
jgi:hypothetical protein